MICKDTIYVNCRNLRFENTGFGNGYTKGYRYDGDKLCIVNKIIGKAALTRQSLLGGLGGERTLIRARMSSGYDHYRAHGGRVGRKEG